VKEEIQRTGDARKCQCAELRGEVQALRWKIERVDEQARSSADEIGRLIGILEKLAGVIQ